MSSLPTELLAVIISHISDRPSLLALSVTAKVLNTEAVRMLYRHIRISSFKTFDAYNTQATLKPGLCHYVRSFEIRLNPGPHYLYWTEERLSSFGVLMSNMPYLVELDINSHMEDDMWNTLITSTAHSGARITHFRCRLRYRINLDIIVSFLEFQPTIKSLKFSSPRRGPNLSPSSIPPSILPNLKAIEGYFLPLNPFFSGRPIRRLNIRDDDMTKFPTESALPVSAEVVRIGCCPVNFPSLPALLYLDLVCTTCQVMSPSSSYPH